MTGRIAKTYHPRLGKGLCCRCGEPRTGRVWCADCTRAYTRGKVQGWRARKTISRAIVLHGAPTA